MSSNLYTENMYYLSPIGVESNNSSKISQTESVIHWEEGEGGGYVYVYKRIEDKRPSTSRLCLVPLTYLFSFATSAIHSINTNL